MDPTRHLGARSTSAFDLYAMLADGGEPAWPRPLREAFAELRALAVECGGRITYLQLKALEGRLSGNLGSTDLFERLYQYAGMRFMKEHGRPFSPIEVMPAMERHFADPAVSIGLDELVPKWAAKTYARLVVSHAKPADLAVMPTEADGGYAQREAFLARFRDFNAPFKKKIDALHGELQRKVPGTREYLDLRAELREALWESHFAAEAMLAQGADLSLAAASAGAEAKEVFDALTLRATLATGADPTTSERRMRELGGDGGSIKVQAAFDQQHELGELPVMREIVELLEADGRLHKDLFRDVEVGLKGHVTPSMLQMLELFERKGGLTHVHIDGKGVSTVPLTGGTVELWAKSYQPGYGDSLLTEREHATMLREQVGGWVERAVAGDRPLLIIGDGYEAARAADEACRRAGKLDAAYVATTQSDLNYLASVEGALGMDVGTLAGTALKDVVTSRLVAEWIAGHELAWIDETKRKPIDRATVVIVGGGNIGGALAEVLKERGAKQVIVADKDAAKVAAQLADKGIEVIARAEGDTLPAGDYYFSCAGFPRTIGAKDLKAMPAGAVIFNCASRRELDEDWLLQTLRGGSKEAIGHVLEPELLPEHRTLALTFRGRDARTVFVRRMAQPAFDGIRDKSAMMMDVVRAGLIAAAVETMERLQRARRGDQRGEHEITPLSTRMQLAILDAVERHYGVDVTKARAASRARA